MATTLEARLVLRAIDQASGVINRVGSALRAVNARSIAAASQGMSRFATSSTALSFPAAMAARSMFQTAVGFDRIRNSAQAAGELTEEQIARFEQAAKLAARELKLLPEQAMDAVKVLVKAGYSFEQTLGMLKPALQGAIAGMGEFGSEAIEVAQSAELAAGIVAGLRLPMQTTEQSLASLSLVNDVVAKSANLSQANFREMGVAFKYAAPLAALTGNNIYELGGAFTVMAKANIKADEAGVALRSGLVRMLKPTKSMQASLKRLNVDLKDFVSSSRQASPEDLEKSFTAHGFDVSGVRSQLKALFADEGLQADSAAFFEKLTSTIAEGLGDGSVLGKDKIADVLTEYFASLGGKVKLVEFFEALRKNGAKAVDLVNIFDVRQGGRLATLLSAELTEMIDRLQRESAGAAAQMAGTMMQGAVGSLENFRSAWANLMIAVARSGVLNSVAKVMDRLAGIFDRMSQMDPVMVERVITAIAGLSAAAPVLLAVSSALGMIGGIATIAAAALANPFVVMAGLIAWGATIIYTHWEEIKTSCVRAMEAIRNKMVALRQAIMDGLTAGWEQLTTSLQAAWDRIVGIFEGASARIMRIIDAIRSGLSTVGNALSNNAITRGLGIAPEEGPKIDGAKASGGDVSAGHTYRINERGQEFFTPSRSGRIIPHGKAGGVAITAPISVSIHIASSNPAEIIRMAKTKLREELQASLRGALADTGLA